MDRKNSAFWCRQQLYMHLARPAMVAELNLSPDDLAGLFNDFSSELIQMDRCLDINNTTNQNPEAPTRA